MVQTDDPWADIETMVSAGKLRARRADATHPYNFYWALDSQGQRILMFVGDSLVFDDALPNLKGVAVELSKERLLLRLLDSRAEDIFRVLCCSLIERTRRASSSQSALVVLLAHLKFWQHFLGKTNAGLLTDNEIRGLFGELWFLKMELFPRFGQDCVQFWSGPFGHPQDFAIGTAAYEVKTTLVGAPPAISISSAEQMWASGSSLYLVHFGIGEVGSNRENSQCIATLVNELRSVLSLDMQDAFNDRLLALGYTDRIEYKYNKFEMTQARYFEVRGNFPRLLAENIPSGLKNIRYSIELAACQNFEISAPWER